MTISTTTKTVAMGLAAALIAAVLVVLVGVASAHAASDATPGKLVTRVVETQAPARASYTSRQVTITQTRYGITGGRLWDVSEHVDWQTRAGWVWNTSMQRSAHGSLTWENDGPVWTNHWGCDGCTNEGWTTKWHMASVPRAPLITENNYPQISVTVYGSVQSNGHYYTYSRSCGC